VDRAVVGDDGAAAQGVKLAGAGADGVVALQVKQLAPSCDASPAPQLRRAVHASTANDSFAGFMQGRTRLPLRVRQRGAEHERTSLEVLRLEKTREPEPPPSAPF
jgi:hypothetical protein